MTKPSTSKRHFTFEKRLALYGVAAGAALASGASAQANLITLDLTGLSVSSRTTPLGGSLYFDVNAGSAAAALGTTSFAGADFFASNRVTSSGATKASVNQVGTLNQVAGTTFKAQRFNSGESVGPANGFQNFEKLGSRFNTSGGGTGTSGNFAPGDTGYIGLRFTINDPSDLHYGWANLTLNSDYTVTLNALGYEDVANMPAAVPEPSAIALLVAGAIGLVAFRRRFQKVA